MQEGSGPVLCFTNWMQRSEPYTASPDVGRPGLYSPSVATAEIGLVTTTSAAPQTSLSRERSVIRSLFLAALLPAIFIVICVAKYGVNVPYGDEWLMIPFLAKDHDHQLAWADLYQQHNEHRIVIPKSHLPGIRPFYALEPSCRDVLLNFTVPGHIGRHLLFAASNASAQPATAVADLDRL